MEFLNQDDNGLKRAIELLKNDEVIAFPTETVFGLGVKASKESNFKKLVEIKKRPSDKPFTLMISNLDQVKNYLIIDDLAKKIIDKFFPGELTLIIKSKDNIPSYLSLNTGYIGIRMPNNDFILKMIDGINEPLLVPSCNPSNEKPAINSSEADQYFHDLIPAIIKGESTSNVPSTIIKIENGKIDLIREGNIKLKDIFKEIDYENCVR